MQSNATPSAAPAPVPSSRRRRKWPWVLAGAGLLALLGGILLPLKLWRASPPGLQPVVKISALDWLQARSLSAAARRWMAAGEPERALDSWSAALANNLAEVGTWRATLRFLRDEPPLESPRIMGVIRKLGWFCSLTHTNAEDVLLAAQVCEHYEAFEPLLALPEPPEPPPALRVARLKAFFRLGRFYEFRDRYRVDREALAGAPGFALYRLAYEAGWGKEAEREACHARLRAALEDPQTGTLAAHLELWLAYRRAEPAAAAQALQKLEEAKAARGLDRAVAWLTFIRADASEQVARQVRDYLIPPASATELNWLGRVWVALKMDQRYQNVMAHWGPIWGASPTCASAQIWANYAGFLETREQWAALRELGQRLRQLPGSPAWPRGFADYLEGRAAYQFAKLPLAKSRLEQAVRQGFPVGLLGVSAAGGLLEMDFPDWADEALRASDACCQLYPAYWRVAWNLALRRRQDSARLLEAARWLYEDNPRNPVTRFNYVAALLTRREQPAEAVRIMRELWRTAPNALYLRLNYALALAQSERHADAAQVLDGVDPSRLTEEERTTYLMGRLETWLHARRWKEARQALADIDRDYLFPCQRRWLDDVKKQLAKASG